VLCCEKKKSSSKSSCFGLGAGCEELGIKDALFPPKISIIKITKRTRRKNSIVYLLTFVFIANLKVFKPYSTQFLELLENKIKLSLPFYYIIKLEKMSKSDMY
jgi:hypothetical protein